MQCKDKFLLQSTIVPSNTDVDDLPPDTVRITERMVFFFFCYSFWNLIDLGWKIFDFAFQFNKDSGKTIEECKLRVVYVSPSSAQGNLEDEGLVSATRSPDANSVSFGILLFALQFLWLVYDIW